MSEEINQISYKLGKIEEGIKDLNRKFDGLPCVNNQKRIEDLEAYKNKAFGMIAVFGAIFGLLGYLISPAVGWLMTKIK